MSVIYFSTKNIQNYQNFVQKNEHFSLWQSTEWKKFQESIGRKTWIIGIEDQEKIIATALVVKHNLPMGKAWLEIPQGPLGNSKNNVLFDEIKKIAKQENAIFCRVNPFVSLSVKSRVAHADNHPQTTLLIDLSLSEENILRQMKAKGRYNIRLAKKKNVIVKASNDVSAFYKLLKDTWDRDKFGGHNENFYKKMLESLDEKAKLYLAYYNDEVIAGGIFTFVSGTAVYYYGASSNKHRNLMAPYLVQWEAIKTAKDRSCKFYDFLGIAPEGKENGHAWEGVTSFKKKFGGMVKNSPKAREIVYKPFWDLIMRGVKFIKK